MSSFNFTLPNGKPFEIKGPPGLTLAQAKAIFDKQADTGALVGIKPGEVLSAATQAAAGLASAQAQLSQTLNGITGALGGGISSAVAQIGSVAQNISGAAASLGSVANQAIGTITKTLSSTPVTAGINVADFAKQATALAPIASLSTSQVTGVLAQAKNLVGQAAGVSTAAKGVGEFGLNPEQLQAAGYLKPGTVEKFDLQGVTGAVDVLKSPTVWTGVNGVTGIDSLLGSAATQSKTMQDLMATGAAGLGQLGIPVASLDPKALAGTLLSAAKSLPDTEKLLKGLPVPTEVKAAFDANVKDGAFAVGFTDSIVPPAFKEIEIPVVAKDTVNRETVNAAATRVVGNSKVPAVNYGPPPAVNTATEKENVIALLTGVNKLVLDTVDKFLEIENKVAALEAAPTISAEAWSEVDYAMTKARASYNGKIDTVVGPAVAAFDAASATVKKDLDAIWTKIDGLLTSLREYSKSLRARILALAEKISGQSS
jgi:hypothetical protein